MRRLDFVLLLFALLCLIPVLAKGDPVQVATGNIYGGPTAAPTATPFAAQVLQYTPCWYGRLNDAVSTPSFSTVLKDSSVNAHNGNYSPNTPLTTGIVNNNGGATAMALPGGTWTNLDQAWAPETLGVFIEPTASVQVVLAIGTNTTIQAAQILGMGPNAPLPYGIALDSGKHFTFTVNIGGTAKTVTSTTTMSAATPYLIVGTYTGASEYITVNGSKQGTTAVSGTITGYDGVAGLGIGGLFNNDGSTLQFGGVMSDVAVFGSGTTGCNSGVMSDTQITNLYNIFAGGSMVSMVVSPLTLTGVAGGSTVSFTATTTGGAGTITATSANASIASVSPASGSEPGPVTFTVTPVAGGNTTIAVSDGSRFWTVSVTVTPPTCGSLPTLTNGQEWPTTFTPYCGSVWTQQLPTPSATIKPAPWSTGVTNIQFASGNQGNTGLTGNVNSIWPGQFDVGQNTYYAAAGDPLINVSCSSFCQTSPVTPPGTMHIPPGARFACSNTDNHVEVVQPDGHIFGLYIWDGCATGSGSGGNWQTGDSLNVTSESYCNWVGGASETGWLTSSGTFAGNQCPGVGTIRANEMLAGYIDHALIFLGDCGGSQAGVHSVFPAWSGSDTQQCTNGTGGNGGNFGPPLGGRLVYNNYCNATGGPVTSSNFPNGLPSSGYKPWELAILCALNQYGAFFTDNFGGSTQNGGFGLQADGGTMFYIYGGVGSSPYSSLTSVPNSWTTQGAVTGALDARYFGASPWNPPGFTATYWKANMIYADPCESHVPRSC